MTDTTAKIRAKGCENTGLDEALALTMHSQVGSHHMAIVELKVVQKHGPDAEGQRAVDLTITQLEPAERGSDLEAHLRNLTRTVYQNRALKADDQQLQIDTADDLEPQVVDVIAAGRAHEPHEWTPDSDGEAFPAICDVCGADEDDPRHETTDVAGTDQDSDDQDDTSADPDDGDEPTEDDPEDGRGTNVVGFASPFARN